MNIEYNNIYAFECITEDGDTVYLRKIEDQTDLSIVTYFTKNKNDGNTFKVTGEVIKPVITSGLHEFIEYFYNQYTDPTTEGTPKIISMKLVDVSGDGVIEFDSTLIQDDIPALQIVKIIQTVCSNNECDFCPFKISDPDNEFDCIVDNQLVATKFEIIIDRITAILSGVILKDIQKII